MKASPMSDAFHDWLDQCPVMWIRDRVEKVGERLYTQFNIYTGRDEDKHHIFTPQLSFFNFKDYKEAQEMCDKLNRIADKYHKNESN